MRAVVLTASETLQTQRAAGFLVEGLRGGLPSDAQTACFDCEEADPEELARSDVLVLGTPVHMAGPAASLRRFFERTAPLWLAGTVRGKVGAAFVTAGRGGLGGAEFTLIALHAFLAEHGYLLVTMPRGIPGFAEVGCHWGPIVETGIGQAELSEGSRAGLRSHGEHIAAVARQMATGTAAGA